MNSQERKERSQTILKSEGVPYIEHLPRIEDEDEARIRSLEEVAWRAMALAIVAVKGEGLEQERVLEISEDYQLMDKFSPKEFAFIQTAEPDEHSRIQFCWRYECYWVLLWALGYVDKLKRPDEICDVSAAAGFLVERTPEQFITDAKLRSSSEILDAADLIYRYDWACVDARIKGEPAPAGLDAGVVMERHYALNWLIGYDESCEWDDVSTDT